VAVIGAGVSGLSAAAELVRLARDEQTPASIALFEADGRPGGQIATSEFSGTGIELGAESLSFGGVETEAAIENLGLTPRLVRPQTSAAGVWDGRKLVPMPQDSVLGVPLHPWRSDVIRAVGPLGAARAALEPLLRRGSPEPDGALGDLVRKRLGRAVLSRLVDPLLGGLYAGPADELSTGAVAPQWLAAIDQSGSLLQGLRQAARGQLQEPRSTLVASFDGGLQTLVDALLAAIPAGSLQANRPATAIEPVEGNHVRVHSKGHPAEEFEGLLMAVPAPAAATLLKPISEGMGDLLRRLEYASVATIALAYPETSVARQLLGSGFLVTRRPRRVVTGCTFMDRKWPHLRQAGRTILTASVGSFGDEWALNLDDTTLITSVHLELRRILGLNGLPLEARIQRWHGALPQYRVGHLAWRASVERAAAALPLRIELAGASFGGVGVAACLNGGAGAAGRLWRRLGDAGPAPERPPGLAETIERL
jgi:oxygen-dependent protoporphyrinogen oxidase